MDEIHSLIFRKVSVFQKYLLRRFIMFLVSFLLFNKVAFAALLKKVIIVVRYYLNAISVNSYRVSIFILEFIRYNFLWNPVILIGKFGGWNNFNLFCLFSGDSLLYHPLKLAYLDHVLFRKFVLLDFFDGRLP